MKPAQETLDWSLPKPSIGEIAEKTFEFVSVMDCLAQAKLDFPDVCYTFQMSLGQGDGIVAVWQTWRERSNAQRLVIFVVEPTPSDRAALQRHLAHLADKKPATKSFIEAFLEAYPLSLTRGWHSLDLLAYNVRIILCFDQVHAVLPQISGHFHLCLVTHQNGSQQRLLDSENIQIHQALDLSNGTLTLGKDCAKPKRPKIRIFGTGIAAASLATACLRRNIAFQIVDLRQGERDASGNPLAIVEPRLTADLGPISRFNLQSFLFAVKFYDLLEAEYDQKIWSTKGVHIWPSKAYPQKRLDKIASLLSAAKPHWFRDDSKGWYLPTAGAVIPEAILNACLTKAACCEVSHLSSGDGVSIHATGPLPHEAGFLTEISRNLIISRGVVTSFKSNALKGVHCGVGYVAALSKGTILTGATFDRLDENPLGQTKSDGLHDSWRQIQKVDVEHNAFQAQSLAQATSLQIDSSIPSDSRASLRATTKDRWPIVGALESEGKEAICVGFGSKGFTHAPLVADHLICTLIGEPGPMPLDLWQRLSPFRNL